MIGWGGNADGGNRVCYCLLVPDDERTRRRLGDATRSRIDDLASGWSLDEPSTPAPEKPQEPKPPSAPVRAKPPTAPPAARAKPPSTPPAPADRSTGTRSAIASSRSVGARAPIVSEDANSASGSIAARPPLVPRAPLEPLDSASGSADTIDDDADAPPAARKKPRTIPPPPPGSEARKQMEELIVESRHEVPRLQLSDVTPSPKERVLSTIPASARRALTKPPTKPPPIPARAKTSSSPPVPPAHPDRTPPVIIEAALIEEEPAIARQLAAGRSGALQAAANLTGPVAVRSHTMTGPVPIGEFDGGYDPDDKLRVALAQATQQQSIADAILGIPPQPPTVVKETPIGVLLDETAARIRIDSSKPTVDPSTVKFERADPTSEGRDDATEIQAPSETKASGGTLRASAMLRRKRGVMGDVRYVFTALFGLRAAKKELATLEDKQKIRQVSRKHHLVTLGRTAVTADSLDHPALGRSREALQVVEEERSKHAGAVAAADAELERVRRDREAKAKQFAADTARTAQELAELAKKLEPLEKQATGVRRRGADLKDQLRVIAKKITDTEALLVSVKSEKMDRGNIQAELASHKADQKLVRRDEPEIAAELDALEPRIASINAQRSEAERKQSERQKAEDEDQRRTTELFEAIGAKRKVVERAATEAETARDAVLFELGERLYVDRPKVLAAHLSPIDRIDLELGESDRRVMELREIISNIDRWKIARGMALIILVLAAGSFTAWLLYMLL